MGLLDILNGMQNGPRGGSMPPPTGQSGGMSPLMMAMLGLLAYKAIKGGGLGNMLGGGNAQAPAAPPSGNTAGGLGDILGGILGNAQSSPGGLGGMLGGILGNAQSSPGGLGGILGGLLGSGAAGSALNGGLRNLLQDMEDHGHGDAAQSWVGTGENQPVAPGDLANALGADTINALSQQTGMPRDQLLSGLSQHLPELVNQLTPNGRLPTEQEASHW